MSTQREQVMMNDHTCLLSMLTCLLTCLRCVLMASL
jgi:hypothetical protein